MHRKLIRVLATFALVFVLSGFGAGAPIYNVISRPITPAPAATMDSLEKAVIRAGGKLGWRIERRGPGKAEGILQLRTHTAYVEITYDRKAFSIMYKNSVNLDYKANENLIHRNYNGWIQNLEKAIVFETQMP